jgi:flavodoxin
MRAAVVHESWFGNTRQIAEAIARALGEFGEATVFTVDEAPPVLDRLDLLVVGAPTHVHGLSSGMSRRSALEQRGETGSDEGVGVRGWLRELPDDHARAAAVFDTRIEKPVLLTGSAARGIAHRLERRGWTLAAPPESFFVLDTRGPLKEGELDRAETWAQSLVRTGVPA